MMDKHSEKIVVADEMDFRYEVEVIHYPHLGFSNANYDGLVIAQVELNRLMIPMSDDDRYWEAYDQKFSEWTEEIKVNIIPKCKEYLNRQGTKTW